MPLNRLQCHYCCLRLGEQGVGRRPPKACVGSAAVNQVLEVKWNGRAFGNGHGESWLRLAFVLWLSERNVVVLEIYGHVGGRKGVARQRKVRDSEQVEDVFALHKHHL